MALSTMGRVPARCFVAAPPQGDRRVCLRPRQEGRGGVSGRALPRPARVSWPGYPADGRGGAPIAHRKQAAARASGLASAAGRPAFGVAGRAAFEGRAEASGRRLSGIQADFPWRAGPASVESGSWRGSKHSCWPAEAAPSRGAAPVAPVRRAALQAQQLQGRLDAGGGTHGRQGVAKVGRLQAAPARFTALPEPAAHAAGVPPRGQLLS
mmetsp:Transcript_95312/g.293944  ORF Transcript_95312/g.293944 Transcript_95312/m.293944 type:complete len:210 (-) Transcript_95312:7-636(-)